MFGAAALPSPTVQKEAAAGLAVQPSEQVEMVGLAEIILTDGRHRSMPVSIAPAILASLIRLDGDDRSSGGGAFGSQAV